MPTTYRNTGLGSTGRTDEQVDQRYQDSWSPEMSNSYRDEQLSRDVSDLFRSFIKSPYRPPTSGGGFFGFDYVKHAANNYDYRQEFLPEPNETEAQWLARLEDKFPGFRAYVLDETNRSGTGPTMLNLRKHVFKGSTPGAGGLSPGMQAAQDEADKTKSLETKREETITKIREFAASLKEPLKMDDPEVKNIMDLTSYATERAARLRGIEGPLSLANTQQAMSGALGNINVARTGLYGDALGFQNDAEAGQLQEHLGGLERRRQDLQKTWERDAAARMRENEAAAAPGRTALGILGGVGTAAASLFTGGLAGLGVAGLGAAGTALASNSMGGGGLGGGFAARPDGSFGAGGGGGPAFGNNGRRFQGY